MTTSQSLHLQRCLDRAREGDASARDELLAKACDRLQNLTRKMLRDFPSVQRWEQSADVLQNALIRLNRALEVTTPADVREFYRLAAVQIRRELIDLSRHYYGPHGVGANHASEAGLPSQAKHEPSDASLEPSRLSLWTEFHQHAEALPAEEKEAFDLLFYQGLSQEEAAELLGVAVRTVKRRWQSARLRLHESLGGELPGI